MRVENKEMCTALTLKEVSALSAGEQLDQKSRENAVLAQQLQRTLDDAQQQTRQSMERVRDKERRSQSKALDLQEQLSRAEAQLSQLHRSKEEVTSRRPTPDRLVVLVVVRKAVETVRTDRVVPLRYVLTRFERYRCQATRQGNCGGG